MRARPALGCCAFKKVGFQKPGRMLPPGKITCGKTHIRASCTTVSHRSQSVTMPSFIVGNTSIWSGGLMCGWFSARSPRFCHDFNSAGVFPSPPAFAEVEGGSMSIGVPPARLSSGISPTACVDNPPCSPMVRQLGCHQACTSNFAERIPIHKSKMIVSQPRGLLADESHRPEDNTRSVFTGVPSLALVSPHIEDHSINLICTAM